jgi:general secretion pathway protein D
VIKGEEEDWLQAKEMIEKLDEPQPQVAIEALILTIRLSERKSLGTQMRSKVPGINGLVGNGVKFQTSGITFGGAPNSFALNTASTATGAQRLLGNLITLATGAGPGNTVVTLGIDTFGVWGIFNALQTIVNTQVISNPFLTATNKQEAVISIGELRRVISGTVISGTTPTNSFANDAANLSLRVRPQINSDGMIVLDLDININEFTDPTAPSSGTKITRQVKTSTIVADKEVIAVGGLIRNEADSSLSKVPILGNIPIIGWLFKNKTKNQIKNNLLILISTRILKPGEAQGISSMTQDRITDYHGTLDEMQEVADKRDPIHRAFFADKENSSDRIIDDFIFDRRHEHDSQKKKKKTSKKNRSSTVPATATRALQLTAQQPAVPKPPLRKPGSAPAHLPPTKAQQSKSTEQKTGKKSIVDLLSQDEGRAPHD